MNVISRDKLAAWIDDLVQDRTVIAPRDVEGVLLYRPVHSSAEVVWDYLRPAMSAKDALFPPTERLMLIDQAGEHITLRESLPEDEQVMFGVRPCDARGLKVLDALFIEDDPPDSWYTRRREHTTLVGLACNQMGDTCFCTSMGVTPDDHRDMDVMLTEVEDGYAVQAVTPKGEALIQGLALQHRPGDPPRQVITARLLFPQAEAWPSHFNDEYWEEMAERCLSCRLCAYVCPTCRCFDVRDETLAAGNGHRQYERIRCWDSCAGEVYRKIAGGHNPRAAKGQRLRNRFFCKFYYYPQQYGPLACTGCGRCIDACPVNIDITEVMQHVSEVNP